MKILVISQERRYERIVRELRNSHEVDYLFISSKFQVDGGDYHLPKLFGFRRGFRLLARITSAYLLLTRRYDVCIADFRSLSIPTIFPIIREVTDFFPTCFVYDIRTIPVDHLESADDKVRRTFGRNLRLADTFYQGLTVITDEMKRYLEQNYRPLKKPVGVWQSGVDRHKFKPADRNLALRRSFGFGDDDFVCFYHGSISRKRGVVELAEAFRILKERDGHIKLCLVGNGSCCSEILEMVSNSSLDNTVKVVDWVDYGTIDDYISMADACVVPLPDIEWWRVSSPFKLMEYIACGKNILLTDMIAHTSVVGKSEEYYWVKEVTAEAFAEKIEEAYRSFLDGPDRFYRKGMAAREKVIDEICWESRARSLQEFLIAVTGAKA